jgi:pyruvate formate lyase activating enzyme
MGIKNYIDMSLIDWDGKVSSVIFIGGCNLRCPFCHNWALAVDPESTGDIDTDRVLELIRSSSGWLDGVVITGGEPTCYSGLKNLLSEIKSMGLLVKLDTNGTRPDVLKELIDQGLVDHIAMDVKNSFKKYSETAGAEVDTDSIAKSIKLIMGLDDYELRTTVVPGLVLPEDLEEICSYIKGSKSYVPPFCPYMP